MPRTKHNKSDGFDDEKKDEEQRENDDETVKWSFTNMCSRCVLIMAKIRLILHNSDVMTDVRFSIEERGMAMHTAK